MLRLVMSSFLTCDNDNYFSLLQRDWNSILTINPQMYCVSMDPVCKRAMRQLIHPTQFTNKEKEPTIGKYSS